PNRTIDAEGLTVGQFTDLFLSGLPFTGLNSLVIDQTGIAGRFDFHMAFAPAPDDPVRQNLAERGADPGEPTAPELAGALQEQLGLKLQPAKGPQEFVVIEHVERPAPDAPPVIVALTPPQSGDRRQR